MEFRQAKPTDVRAITALFRQELLRDPSEDTIIDCLSSFPSAVCYSDAGDLVGFAYCGQFAPDIVELYNILVDARTQSKGIGTGIMECLFTQLSAISLYKAVIVVNSQLYPPMREPFRFGTGFYKKNGFKEIADTGDTKIFYRELT